MDHTHTHTHTHTHIPWIRRFVMAAITGCGISYIKIKKYRYM